MSKFKIGDKVKIKTNEGFMLSHGVLNKSPWKKLGRTHEVKKIDKEKGLFMLDCDCNCGIWHFMHEWEIFKEVKLKKRTEVERVAYLVGQYFTGAITLHYLKIQINAIEEPLQAETTTAN